ncbi:membrane protein insertase YidC [Candidatus Jorgensenbacteria bacterium]|nr:membrane protein insertase YidC [Candidatus Jorgensenbacteria bacterium]
MIHYYMTALYQTYIYQPILSVLIFIYNTIAGHDLGIAIVLLTILVRIVLFPIFYKGARDQTIMQRLQPHIQKIQSDNKGNREEQARKLMSLYKEHRLNPFSGFLLIIIQLPIFIALFNLFTKELSGGAFDSKMFLGLIDLESKSLPLVLIAAVLQYYQGKISVPSKNSSMPAAGKMMVFLGPILTVVVLSTLPSALGLYWIVSTLFSIAQQIYINKKTPSTEHG